MVMVNNDCVSGGDEKRQEEKKKWYQTPSSLARDMPFGNLNRKGVYCHKMILRKDVM
jgi:hypothetical protein